ncbi:MAG: Trm112 family protein [Candidatus Zixiibacteriota bacterium]
MPLSDKLVEKLVCPECRKKIIYELEKNRLVCTNCRLVYPITNNVPVLLTDEAEKL